MMVHSGSSLWGREAPAAAGGQREGGGEHSLGRLTQRTPEVIRISEGPWVASHSYGSTRSSLMAGPAWLTCTSTGCTGAPYAAQEL